MIFIKLFLDPVRKQVREDVWATQVGRDSAGAEGPLGRREVHQLQVHQVQPDQQVRHRVRSQVKNKNITKYKNRYLILIIFG